MLADKLDKMQPWEDWEESAWFQRAVLSPHAVQAAKVFRQQKENGNVKGSLDLLKWWMRSVTYSIAKQLFDALSWPIKQAAWCRPHCDPEIKAVALLPFL